MGITRKFGIRNSPAPARPSRPGTGRGVGPGEFGIVFIPHSAFRIPKCNIGFTLIELVFVMAVLGILLVAAIPRFSRTAERLQVEQRAFELTQLLRYAHERAVTQGAEVVWVWDAQARQAHLEVVMEDGATQPLEERLATSALLPAAVSVSLARDGTPVDRIRFLPDGTSEATTLQLVQDSTRYLVTIDGATGQAILATGSAAR